MRSWDNLHKWATHSPADAADCTVPATVPGVRRLRDDVPLVRTVRSKPDDIDDRAEPVVGLVPVQHAMSVHKEREQPKADPVSIHKPLDTADAGTVP